MNLEQLNKTQIILLTLLVSFVTSIATAIATAALIQKAPADITRVISHTIEQPVQTVVPGQTEVVTKTVVVQQSDLIGQAIQKIQPSIVQIFEKGKPLTAFLALGAVIDAKGMILTDASVFNYCVLVEMNSVMLFLSSTIRLIRKSDLRSKKDWLRREMKRG
jgi:hypothetical protein